MPQYEDLTQSLLRKLFKILNAGADGAQEPKNRFIAWCAPGIAFDPADLRFAAKGLDGKDAQETKQLIAQASDFARWLDMIPDANGIYQTQSTYEQSGARLSEVYNSVLRFSEVATGSLTPEQKAKLEKFQNLLQVKKTVKNIVTDAEEVRVEDGPVLKAYNEKMANYLSALTTYNNKRLSALNTEDKLIVQDWALNGDNYRQQVRVAMDAWTSGGYRNEVDAMNAFIAQVTQRDLTLWKRQLQDQFDSGKLKDLSGGSDFYFTSITPGNFADSPGWSTFSFSDDVSKSYESSETNSWGGDAGGSPSFWSRLLQVNLGSSGTIGTEKSTIDTSNFKMSFSLIQVPISRPWFSPEFLKNTAWRFQEGTGMQPLSNGGTPPQGQLCAYSTTAIFIRDLKIDFSELHKQDSKYTQQITANAGVSFGPFSLGGSYNRSKNVKEGSSQLTSAGLSVAGMQIIGFKCALLPQSPNPSNDIREWS